MVSILVTGQAVLTSGNVALYVLLFLNFLDEKACMVYIVNEYLYIPVIYVCLIPGPLPSNRDLREVNGMSINRVVWGVTHGGTHNKYSMHGRNH
ncbi:hypothetical protein F4779DRAFT_581389 [Xylariaceae sp. FL0662B]|nr:hypothetical protein F4779DRAFT_581389 [Xylariaceae sp. FL0662B]